MLTTTKRILIAGILFGTVIVMQGFTRQAQEHEEKAKNLKVLPKDMSGEEIHKLMKTYSQSLGVRCGFCHEVKQNAEGKWDADFAADTKKEKETARKMMKMTAAINKKYIKKMGDGFEPITCVTCHMGRSTPIVSTDSLPQKKK